MPRFLLLLLFIPLLSLKASEVQISGVSSLPGYPVRVLFQDDLISGRERQLASASSDFKGSFTLRFEMPYPGWISLGAAQYRTELFVVPGGKYSLQLEIKKGESTAFFDPQPLTVKTIKADDGNLSDAISSVNLLYNAFVMEHFNALYRMQQARLIDTLRSEIQKIVRNTGNQFLKDYTFYKVASLEPVVRQLRPAQVYDRFFRNRPVLANQPEYVSLLRETFKNYLIQSRIWTQQEYDEALTGGWKTFERLLLRDAILAENAGFRELVVLIHFAENFTNPLHRKGAPQRVLNELASATRNPDHARIARNIIIRAEWLMQGTNSPHFTFNDESGKPVKADENSTAMLLIIVGPDCRYCDFELQQLRDIHGRIGSQYLFVTISLPESYQYYRNLHRRNKLDWPVVSLGHNYPLLDALEAKVLPFLAIYLPGAKAGMIPAPPTDQHLEGHLQRLAKQFAKP